LYDELKPLVVDGPGWAFVRRFNKARDGRAAVLALRAQAEGPAAEQVRIAKAYASISTTVYRGQRHGFKFSDYMMLHQEAHNELYDLEETLSETKKVRDFLKGIQDPTLVVGKTVVLSDPAKLSDFELCQHYLSTLVENTSVQAKTERNVSSAHRSGGGGEGSPNGSLVDRIKGGQYSSEQFKSLTKEEKDRVARYREESKKKKSAKKKSKAHKRRLSKATTERDESEDAEGQEEETSGAGAQFGQNGNRNKKSKKD
jgi:hypothetical protein